MFSKFRKWFGSIKVRTSDVKWILIFGLLMTAVLGIAAFLFPPKKIDGDYKLIRQCEEECKSRLGQIHSLDKGRCICEPLNVGGS